MNAQRIATIAVALLGLLSACGQAPTPTPENFKGKLLGTVTVQFDGNTAKATVTPFKPNSSRQGRDFNVSINFVRKFTGAFDDDGTNSRYAWATFEVANTSINAISNLNLIGVNFAGKGLGLTPFQSLENLNGQAITNPAIAQSVRPMHGIKVNGTTLEVDPSKADFQAFGDLETQAIEDSAKQAGLLQQLDDVLEYGFVARNNTGGRAIAPNGTGQVTLALRMPKPASALENPYRFQMTYLLVDEPNIRVTRSIEETTAQVTARAQAVNATEAVLIGADTDTVPGVTNLRLTNARVSSAPQYYIPSQTLAFRIDSPIGVIPANQCTTLTAASSDGGSLGSGVIWSKTGQGALSNQTGTTVTFCAPDVATTASVNINAVLRDDSTKSSTLGLSLQAPASVGVATLNVGGSGTAITGDSTIRVTAADGALIQNTAVSIAKFQTPLFAAPSNSESIGESITVQLTRDALNPVGIATPIVINLNPTISLDTSKNSYAEVRIVLPNNQELSLQTVVTPSKTVQISPRVLWLITKNYPSMSTITLKIAVQQSKASFGLTATRPQTRAFIAQTGLFVFPDNQDNVPSELDSACTESYQDPLPSLFPVTGNVPPRTDGKIPLILIHGWLGTDALNPLKIRDAIYPSHCYWKSFIKFFYRSNLNERYALYSYAYESTSQSVVNNGNLLEQKIQDAFGNQPISILAHSMGGLIARYYMAKNLASHNVKQLITLGTPYAGVVPISCLNSTASRNCALISLNFAFEAQITAAFFEQNQAAQFGALGILQTAAAVSSLGSLAAGTAGAALAAHTALFASAQWNSGTRDLAGNYGSYSTPYLLNIGLGGWDELNDRIYSIYGCNPTDGLFKYFDLAIRRVSGSTCSDGIVTEDSAKYNITHSQRIENTDHNGLLNDNRTWSLVQARLTDWYGPVRAFAKSGGMFVTDMVSKGSSLYVLGGIGDMSRLPGDNTTQADGQDVFIAKISAGKLDWQRIISMGGNQYPLGIFLSEEIDANRPGNLIVFGSQNTNIAGVSSNAVFALKVTDSASGAVSSKVFYLSGGSTAIATDPIRKRIYLTGYGNAGTVLDPNTNCPSRYFLGYFDLSSGDPNIQTNMVKSRCPANPYLSASSINVDNNSVYLTYPNTGDVEKVDPDNLFGSTVSLVQKNPSLDPIGISFRHFLNQNGTLSQIDIFGVSNVLNQRLSILDPSNGLVSQIRTDLLWNNYYNQWSSARISRTRDANKPVNDRSAVFLVDSYPNLVRSYLNLFSTYMYPIRVQDVNLVSGAIINTFFAPLRSSDATCSKTALGTFCASNSANGIDIFKMQPGSTPY